MSTSILPGVTVSVDAEVTPPGLPTATGQLFAVGVTERGPLQPTRVGGLNGFRRQFGDRTHYATADDGLRAFWSVGGADVWFARVVGPAAEAASVTLQDGEAVDTLEVSARDVGGHGNDLEVEVAADGDGFQLIVFDDGDEVERWRRLDGPGDAADRLSASRLIRAADLGSASSDPSPSTGTFELTGGDDDRGNIGDDEWADALARFDRDLGPGQVAAPGRDSDTGRAQLVDHAEQTKRIAFLDGGRGDGQDALELIAADHPTRRAALFAPHLQTTIDGRTRTVSAAMVAAGLAARLDASQPQANLAPDLSRAQLPTIAGVDVDFDDDQHGELNGQGVNIFRATRHAGVLLRGWRSLSPDEAWVQLNQVRYISGLTFRLENIAERYVFRVLTPPTVSDFGNALKAELKGDFDAGALFGDSTDEAYSVEVGDDVNPPADIEQGLLRAAVAVKVSPFAERITLNIVKANLTTDLS